MTDPEQRVVELVKAQTRLIRWHLKLMGERNAEIEALRVGLADRDIVIRYMAAAVGGDLVVDLALDVDEHTANLVRRILNDGDDQ